MYKRIFEFELQLSSYWQNIKFSRNWPKFHIFANIVIFKYICNFLDQLLHPYKWYGSGMSGILFFIFATCEPLRPIIRFAWITGENFKAKPFLHLLYNCRVQIKAYFSSSKWNRLIPLLDPTPKFKFRFTWNSRGKICSCVARHAPLPCWKHNTSYINHKHLSTW